MDAVTVPPLWLSTALARLWSTPLDLGTRPVHEARRRAALLLRSIEADDIPAPIVGRNARGFPSLRWEGEQGREVMIVVYPTTFQCVVSDVSMSIRGEFTSGYFEAMRRTLAWIYRDAGGRDADEIFALAQRMQP